MILVAGALLAVVSVPLCGGRLLRLREVRFRGLPLLMVALAIQLALLQALHAVVPRGIAAGAHVLSYALALSFVWCNRRIPGLWLIALGGAANLTAIFANGGVMPASPAAAALAGMDDAATFENSVVMSDANVAWLGDVFAWPRPLPLANVFSVGDVVLLLGAALLLHTVCRSRLVVRRRPVLLP